MSQPEEAQKLCFEVPLTFAPFHLFIWLHWILRAACRIFNCGIWDLAPQPRIPTLHWERRVLATGSPGKFHLLLFIMFFIYLGCAGSSLLHVSSLVVVSGSDSLWRCVASHPGGSGFRAWALGTRAALVAAPGL